MRLLIRWRSRRFVRVAISVIPLSRPLCFQGGLGCQYFAPRHRARSKPCISLTAAYSEKCSCRAAADAAKRSKHRQGNHPAGASEQRHADATLEVYHDLPASQRWEVSFFALARTAGRLVHWPATEQ